MTGTGPAVRLQAIEVVEVALPLVRPFRTSFGEERTKDALLVRVDAGDVAGWGECVASPEPRYSEEWLFGSWLALVGYLGRSLLAGGPIRDPEQVGRRLAWVRGHRMAKAALEASVRYLARDLGPKNIRVNAISAGPVSTLAARGVSGFTEILGVVKERAALRRNIDQDEVADVAAFLASHWSRGITGEVMTMKLVA